VLRDLNLKIPSGSFAAILGPSGCGKTTLLRSIAGLITPSGGAIRFGKQLVSVSSLVLPPHKRNIGYVPQEGGLFPHLSVAENVSFSFFEF
jgi:iron(III) transport system ATP-binding protein